MWPMSAATPAFKVLDLACMACTRRLGRTGSQADIVEGELANPGVELQEEGQRLPNATGGTEDGDLGRLPSTSQHLRLQFAVRCCSGLFQQKATAASGNTVRTWRADEEKVRREAWEKACLAANMVTAIGCGGRCVEARWCGECRCREVAERGFARVTKHGPSTIIDPSPRTCGR